MTKPLTQPGVSPYLVSEPRVAELRAEYASLHERALHAREADMDALQRRENEIVIELRKLGRGIAR